MAERRSGYPELLSGAAALAVGDVTGDGRPDLVVANSEENDVAILPNAAVGRERFTITLLNLGTGEGQIVSVPSGILCGSDCTADFESNREVHLVPIPAFGSAFAGFTGEPGCAARLMANTDRACIGIFNLIAPPPPRTRLAVYKRGLWTVDEGTPGVLENCRVDTCGWFGDAQFGGNFPVVGDWTGRGRSSFGLHNRETGMWFLDVNGNLMLDGCDVDACYSFTPWYGRVGYVPSITPLVGDWTGDGRDKIGMVGVEVVCVPYHRSCPAPTGFLDLDGNGTFDGCTVDKCFGQQGPGTPVAGDWLGLGIDRIGMYRGNGWWLDVNGNFTDDGCAVDLCADFGLNGAMPVVGDWDDSGRDKIGLYLHGLWVLDWNGNLVFDGCEVDRCVLAGDAKSIPVPGKY
jgi:hypothetical protein